MEKNKKILVFVSNGKKLLSLLHNGKNPEHGGWFWFTITGSVEEGETIEEAAKREIKEETGLDIREIFDLNWGSVYNWFDRDHEERNLIAFVEHPDNIKLDMREVVDYKWVYLEEFINLIRWDDDKTLLKVVLKKALNKEKHFSELNIVDYRK